MILAIRERKEAENYEKTDTTSIILLLENLIILDGNRTSYSSIGPLWDIKYLSSYFLENTYLHIFFYLRLVILQTILYNILTKLSLLIGSPNSGVIHSLILKKNPKSVTSQ